MTILQNLCSQPSIGSLKVFQPAVSSSALGTLHISSCLRVPTFFPDHNKLHYYRGFIALEVMIMPGWSNVMTVSCGDFIMIKTFEFFTGFEPILLKKENWLELDYI